MNRRLDRLSQLFERRQPGYWAGLGGLLVCLLGIVDYLTGNDIVFSLFYLIPILLLTLAVSEMAGVYTSVLSALILLAAEIAAGQSYSHPAIYFWNTAIRAVFFSFFLLPGRGALPIPQARETDGANRFYQRSL